MSRKIFLFLKKKARRRPVCRFATLLFLLGAPDVAFAQNGLPIWVPPDDAAAQGCPAPTLAQCSDPDWLYSEDPCAILQNKAQSACVDLYWEAVEPRVNNGEEVVAVLPENLDASGVGKVLKSEFNVVAQQREYVSDVFSITSQEAQLDYVGSQTLGVDLYGQYEDNGTEVDTCLEYAYEAFYDVNEFQRKIGFRRGDFRYIVDTAFGDADDSASIGTRHLQDYKLKSKDGVFFGSIFAIQNIEKNLFFRLPQHPFPPQGEAAIVGAPPLLNSIALRSKSAHALLQKIELNKGGNDHIVNKTWAWNKEMSDLLHQEPPSGDLFLELGFAELGQADNQAVVDQFSSFQAAGQSVRRRLDDELDGLFVLQESAQALISKWGELNAIYSGSGWNVVDAGLEDDAPDLGNILIAPVPAAHEAPQNFAANPVENEPPGNVPAQALDIVNIDPETVQRRAILDALVDILHKADNEGCLQKGATACDWSPLGFAKRVLFDFSAAEDAALSWCRDFTKGAISNVLNLNIAFVDDPDYPEYACSVVTGDGITAKELRGLSEHVDFCRKQEIAYRRAKAIDDAKDRVREVPELFDASTGGFKMPGIDKSRDEYMGNKYFGLGYNYSFGFNMDVQAEICHVALKSGGHLDVYAKLLGQQVSLIDAATNIDTDVREAHLSAEVLGIELFNPIDREWSTQEDMHFNVVKTPKKAKRQDIVNVRIVIVVVPLKLVLGIAGEVGAHLGLTIDTTGLGGDACPSVTVGGLVEPYVSMSGYVAASIDLFVVEAGIRGELNIITVRLPFKPGLKLELIGDENDDLLPDDLELTITAKLDLKLTTLSGKIQAYAKVGLCPFCVNKEFTFVTWVGPKWKTTLFEQSYTVGLGDLNAAFNL